MQSCFRSHFEPKSLFSIILLIGALWLLTGTQWSVWNAAAKAQSPNINFLSGGLAGLNLSNPSNFNPTSLQFGPDDRLYVSQQDGTIYALTIQRNGPADYTVIATEEIDLIRKIQNHNDDGALNNDKVKRQVTGIYVTGSVAQPVLYVSSSDWRIGGGSSGSDINLDTNSGMVSRLTWNSASQLWDKVDLVRGLPRSEENHSVNGMALDEANGKLYLMVGSNTNSGAPSFKFALSTEYAYAAAMLEIDLNALNALPILGSGDSQYVYDLPTLDDPSRPNTGPNGSDENDPFGGNDGLNQAKLDPSGPVQLYATGFRNGYDVLLTTTPGAAGRLYTIDNGPNSSWGGYPENEGPAGNCTNEYNPAEPGSQSGQPDSVKDKDVLHFVNQRGFYGGHPSAIRGNPTGAGLYTHDGASGQWRTAAADLPVDWPPVPANLAHPVECDFYNPGTADDPALVVYTDSTNGLAEYTASNFGNALKGNLLAASFSGDIYRIVLNASGDQVTNGVESFASGFGSTPLDVTVQGDDDIFPGTVWAATYGADAITVFEPADYGGGSVGNCTGEDNPALDEDNDQYTNADEIDNGANPCSAASRPDDNDGDHVSDLNDTDDDNDGILDTTDAFAIDAQNGATTNLPISYTLLNNDPGTGFFGLGFTGLMSDGATDYLNRFDSDNLVAGGAVGLFTITDVTPGDALQSSNSQREAFQFGVNVSTTTGPFQIRVAALGPFFNSQPTDFKSHGFYIGTGDQDNYLKLAVMANGGAGGIQVLQEQNGTLTDNATYPVSNLLDAVNVDLYLWVDPAAGTVQPKYAIENGPVTNLGAPLTLQANVKNAVQSAQQALAVGLIATSRGADPFGATWDHIDILPVTSGQWTAVNASNGSKPQARHESAYVNVGDKFYLLGGRGAKTVDIFDPAAKTWVAGTHKPPFQIHHFQGVEFNGLIYILGAFTGSYPDETPVANVYIYNPDTDLWIEGPLIPAARQRGATGAVVYNNKIYIVGGIVNGHSSGWVSWLDEFDPSSGHWTALPDAPRNRDHFHAVVIGDKLYAAGGRNSGLTGVFDDTIVQVDVYNFTTGQWTTMPNNIPTERAGAATVVVDNELLVIGGESGAGSDAHVETEALNVATGEWRTLDDLIQGRHGTQALVYDGAVYMAAGAGLRGSAPELDTQEMLPLAVTLPTPSALSAAPDPLHFFAQEAGTSSAPAALTLINTGGAAIDITGVSITGGSASAFSHDFSAPFAINPGGNATLNIVFAPLAAGLKTATLKVTHSGQGSLLNVTLNGEATAGAIASDILYRVNAGGPEAIGGDGVGWSSDTDANPSPYRTGGKVYSTSSAVAPAASVPPDVPAVIFQTERYDPVTANVMKWDFPVTVGKRVEVRLYFAEIYLHSGNNSTSGPRVFDVQIDGAVPTVFNDLDLFAEVGSKVGVMKSFVTTSDGNVDIDFIHIQQNPNIKGIELVDVTPNTPPTVVNPPGNVQSNVGDGPTVIDLSNVFTDAEDGAAGLELSIVANSNPTLVTAALSGQSLQLSYIGSAGGTAQITIKATDSRGLSATASFTVTVNGGSNTAPTVATGLADLVVGVNSNDLVLNLTNVFADAEEPASALRLSVSANTNPALVNAQVSSRSLRLSFAAESSGVAEITVRAADGGGLFAEDTFKMTVSPQANTAPYVLNPIADQTVGKESQPTTLSLSNVFRDLEDISAALKLSVAENTNPALVAAVLKGTDLTLTFAPGMTGVAQVTIGATDTGGLTTADAFQITVTEAPNQPPLVAAMPNPVVAEGKGMSLGVAASDPDGDALTLSATGLPTGATFEDNGNGAGALRWTPSFDDAGAHAITIQARDAKGAASSRDVTIMVTNVNRPPAWAAVSEQAIVQGTMLQLTIRAVDPDGDALTLAAAGLPATAVFTDNGDGSATIAWQANTDSATPFTVMLTATDPAGLSAQTSFVVRITPAVEDAKSRQYMPFIFFEGRP
ncbi:MAG: kelch repeat-containing protein [Caldilineaceae bacterium]